MFYSESDDEDERVQRVQKENKENVNFEDDLISDNTRATSSPRPTSSRPMTARSSAAARKAQQMEEKRKQRASTPGMIVASETPPKPSLELRTAKQEETVMSSSPRVEIKDLLKERKAVPEGGKEKTATETEQMLLAQGINPTFDPSSGTALFTKVPPPTEKGGNDNMLSKIKPTDPSTPPSNNSPSIPRHISMDMSDIKSILTRPAPVGKLIECRVQREKSGVDKLHPSYFLYLEDGSKFLLAARRRKKSKTSNYLISLEKEDMNRNSGNFCGKVRSNFMGTEFVFFDKGESPKGSDSDVGVRQELGAVVFSANVLGLKGPRKMVALLPKIGEDGNRMIWKPMKDEDSIVEKYRKGEVNNMFVLQHKEPVWNQETQSYCLNFHQRVKLPSVKNFQLVSPQDDDRILFQFGRVDKLSFSMDFQYPFSLLQAFMVALTAFDNKWACE